MNIVIYRVNAEELEQILEKICLKLDIPYKYDKDRRLISIENGILHPVYIDGVTGPCEKLVMHWYVAMHGYVAMQRYAAMHGYVAMQITPLFMDSVLNSVPQHFLDAKIKQSEYRVDAFLELFQNFGNR